MPIVYGNAIHLVSASSQYAWALRVSNAVNNFTIAFWLRVASLPSGTQHILMNGDENNHEGYHINISSTGLLTLDMIFVDGSCKTTTAISTNTWTHYIFERASGTSTAYINAVANGNTSASTPNSINTDADTIIGAGGTKGSPQGAAPTSIGGYLNGDIDELRFYERALSSTERTNLYNYGLNVNNGDISNANLVAQYKFDESSGNPADSSGNSHTLTAINTPTFITGIQEISNIPDTAALTALMMNQSMEFESNMSV